ncbi:hypothetical protein ACP70R_015497 [Stipagrostis hirtigluma subsp. patula]
MATSFVVLVIAVSCSSSSFSVQAASEHLDGRLRPLPFLTREP